MRRSYQMLHALVVLTTLGSGEVARADDQEDELPEFLMSEEAAAPTSRSSQPLSGYFADSLTGDFTRDRRADVVTVSTDGTVSFLRGVGAGRVAPPVTTPIFAEAGTNQGADVLAQGDFDRNGVRDLVAGIDPAGTGLDCALVFLRGRGDGTFSVGTPLLVSHDPTRAYKQASCTSIVSADVNRDGRLDAVLAYTFIPVESASPPLYGAFNVFLGNGNGSFQPGRFFDLAENYGSRAMVSADFDRDGRLDLVFGEQLQYLSGVREDFVEVWLGDGRGSFAPTTLIPIEVPLPNQLLDFEDVVSADFNRDGRPDIALISNRRFAPPGQAAITMLGLGDGTFGPPTVFATTLLATDLATADFDANGTADLALTDGGTLFIHPGRGDGTFGQPWQLAVGGSLQAVLPGHFDSGRRIDLAWVGGADTSNTNLTVLSNTGCIPPFVLDTAPDAEAARRCTRWW